jgi:hypothetical protein
MHERYRLKAGIAFCSFEDCAILLDAARDRYFRLSRSDAAALQWVADIAPAVPDPRRIERLIRSGFIETGPPGALPQPDLEPPQASILEAAAEVERRFSIATAVSVAWWTIAAHAALRTRRLERLLAGIGRRRRNARPPRGDLAELAMAFSRYRQLVPITPVCLPDSLALLEFLGRRGHSPQLVMAVAAHPFAAHCWVQADRLVLNDALDHAMLFRPILVV